MKNSNLTIIAVIALPQSVVFYIKFFIIQAFAMSACVTPHIVGYVTKH